MSVCLLTRVSQIIPATYRLVILHTDLDILLDVSHFLKLPRPLPPLKIPLDKFSQTFPSDKFSSLDFCHGQFPEMTAEHHSPGAAC